MIVETRAQKRKVEDGFNDNVSTKKSSGVQTKKRKVAPTLANISLKTTSKPVEKSAD
jgi:hypothetical protein